MRNAGQSVLLLIAMLNGQSLLAEDAPPPKRPTQEAVTDAVQRGLSVLEKAAKNYPEHRDCFACHHQTVPLAAMREARRIGLVDEPLFGDTVQFVQSYFDKHADEMKQGRGIPGRAFMVGYGAWSFELADVDLSGELRVAMSQYVIQRQEPDGRWRPASIRPPAEQSEVMNTALALRVLRPLKQSARPFAADAEWSVTAEATERHAQEWLNEAPLKWQDDFVARLWSLHWFGDETNQRAEIVRKIVERQRPDGGWAAEDELKSEAYSTGMTLFALLDTGESPTSAPIVRGLAYLLQTQHADGSWLVETRAKPVQVFFDNGDPHGKNQFISISATGWSVAALARSLFLSRTLTH